MKELDPEDVILSVGRRCRELRLERGYTNQDDFAYEHGFNRSQYSQYEQGMNLTIRTLVRLANAYQVSLKELFD